MRVVDPDGSLPASAEPRRIDRNGIASTSMISVAPAANSSGRCCSLSLQLAQRGDSSLVRSLPSRSCRRSGRRSTFGPKKPSRAGSSVSAATTVKDTATEAATATPYRKLTPSANIPSIAMQTIIPANITARPEVSSDSITACSLVCPRSSPWR